MLHHESNQSSNHRPSTLAIVSALKQHGQDKEWYPTTDEIIQCVRDDLTTRDYYDKPSYFSGTILDIGAGDGRFLKGVTNNHPNATYLAIEQSSILIEQQDADIITIGTDFNEQTLLDKECDITICNPPYAFFQEWAIKIIRESCASKAYLVIPKRWEDNVDIQEALKRRNAKAEVIGEFDFLEADRKARAKVHVVKIDFNKKRNSGFHTEGKRYVDPFELFFEETFTFEKKASKRDQYEEKVHQSFKDSIRQEVAAGRNYIELLEERYHAELERIFSLYSALCKMDSSILSEVGVDRDRVQSSLKRRISTLKNTYWRELFDNFEKITERLCYETRTALINILHSKASNLDFSARNAHAIASWVIKNANQYFDSQIDTYMRSMLDSDKFMTYKSNTRTFKEDRWRYSLFEIRQNASHFKFDYRVVLPNMGGLDFGFNGHCRGIEARLVTFINDTLAIASTLGFDTSPTPRCTKWDDQNYHWQPGEAQIFTYYNHTKDKVLPLFRVKSFKNGNAHIQYDPKFMLALNIALGRINGWLRSKEEAAEELDADIADVSQFFDAAIKITKRDALPQMGFNSAA